MAGMVHANDVRIAEGLRDIELPGRRRRWRSRPGTARSTTRSCSWHRDAGARHPRPQRARSARAQRADGLLLPALLRAADVQQRVVVPLPPARTGGDADGDLVADAVPRGRRARAKPTPPELWECDDPRWPPIPAQDFSNLPRQQKGLHAKGFEYMRLSERLEGHISNFERTVDGFLAGLPYEQLLPALQAVNVNPLDRADRRPRLLTMEPMHATYADVVEGVRAAIAAYTHALDDGRTDDVVATFCPDGVCRHPRAWAPTKATTRCARRTTKWKPRRPQRHLVVNTLVTDWNDHEAQRDQRRGLPAAGRRRAGRSRSSAATTTPSTTTTARGASTGAPPSS